MPADEGPSLARTRTVPCSMMSRLRDDSQRTAAESTRAPRLALEQQQELEPKTLEQQLKDNEAWVPHASECSELSELGASHALGSPKFEAIRVPQRPSAALWPTANPANPVNPVNRMHSVHCIQHPITPNPCSLTCPAWLSCGRSSGSWQLFTRVLGFVPPVRSKEMYWPEYGAHGA